MPRPSSRTAPGRPVLPLGSRWLLCLAFAAGCGGEPAPPPPTASVERTTIERIVIATGTVEPATEVEVRPRIAGIIEKIHVEEGDRVAADQPLVEIERRLLGSQVREAEAAVREAEVEARFAKIALDREQKMQASGAASDQKLDDAQARHQRARAALARARARLETLSTQLGYATVRSSLDGRVLEVHEEEGSAVSPVTSVTGGTLLLSVAGDDAMHLEGLVDENEIARVEIGQPARIRTEAFPERIFRGEVSEIAPLGQRVQNVTYFEVKILITDPEAAKLRPRMSGDARIVTETVEDAVVVPETALHYRGDEIYVELPGAVEGDGNGARPSRTIRIGIIDGDQVQVLEGLEPGQEVVLK